MNEKIEKRILKISLYAGLVFVVIELGMAFVSKSQSVLMDAAFDASELLVILVSILLTPLLYRPITESKPFGYAQCESLFLFLKGGMLCSVILSLIVSNIQIIINGGNKVDTNLIFGFEALLAFFSSCILFVLLYYGKKVNSPLTEAEIYGWKLDVMGSLGVSAAFVVPYFFENTFLSKIAPYFDQGVAIILALLMLPECIKMLLKAFRDILLFAPQGKRTTEMKKSILAICEKWEITVRFIDVLQTGRKMWIAVTIVTDDEVWNIQQMRQVYGEINSVLKEVYQDASLELIPDLTGEQNEEGQLADNTNTCHTDDTTDRM